MIRRIIHIDEEKCNGCGACADACHESAIGMVDGKAKLLRDDYCDGLGDCLPTCPTGAITVKSDQAAVWKALYDPNKRVIAQIAPAVRDAPLFQQVAHVLLKGLAVFRHIGVAHGDAVVAGDGLLLHKLADGGKGGFLATGLAHHLHQAVL